MIELKFYVTVDYIEYKNWKHHFNVNITFGNTNIPEINFLDEYEPTTRNSEFDVADIEDAAYEKLLIAFDEYLHGLGFDFMTDISVVKKTKIDYGIVTSTNKPKSYFFFYERLIMISGDMRQLTFFKMKYM